MKSTDMIINVIEKCQFVLAEMAKGTMKYNQARRILRLAQADLSKVDNVLVKEAMAKADEQ